LSGTGRLFADQIATGESIGLEQAMVAAEVALTDIVNRAAGAEKLT